MTGYIIRRFVVSALVLFVASFLVFALVASLGDPTNITKLKTRNPPVSPAYIQRQRHALGLDDPVIDRYGRWLKDFAPCTYTWVSGVWTWVPGLQHANLPGTCNMGMNTVSKPVKPELTSAFGVTMRLVLGSTVLSLLLAVALGVYSSVRQYSISDYTATFFSFVFLSMPVFWLALLLKAFAVGWINNPSIFGLHLWHSQALSTLYENRPSLSGGFWTRLGDTVSHAVLPIVTLTLITFASWGRYQRGTMLEVLDSDYIRLARAKGVSSGRVLTKHALRNALIPLTTVAAIDVGTLFAGAIITETVFDWHGMGVLFISAVNDIDINTLLAWLMLTGAFIILFNLFADLLYGVLDPRIRLS